MRTTTTPAKATTAPPGPTSFVEDYLLYLLARVSTQASAQFHARVKQHGLSVAEWRVLGACWGGPQTIGELAAMTLFQQPTLTKIVDRMVVKGWVAKTPDIKDGRRVIVSLTEAGAGLAEELVPMAKKHEAEILSGLVADQAALVKKTLRALIEKTDT